MYFNRIYSIHSSLCISWDMSWDCSMSHAERSISGRRVDRKFAEILWNVVQLSAVQVSTSSHILKLAPAVNHPPQAQDFRALNVFETSNNIQFVWGSELDSSSLGWTVPRTLQEVSSQEPRWRRFGHGSMMSNDVNRGQQNVQFVKMSEPPRCKRLL